MAAIAWLLVDFYDVQFIEQALHGEVWEEMVLVHFLLDVGQVHQCHELDEQLAFEVFLRGDGHAAHVQAFFQIAEGFLDRLDIKLRELRLNGCQGLPFSDTLALETTGFISDSSPSVDISEEIDA